jgi:branched-chain amino acid transport system permease protein
MDFASFIQYCLSGVTNGSVYAIVAIGFNIIYNTTGIINFAQGEFVIVGAMSAIGLSAVLPLPAAIVLAVLLTMALGGAMELVFIRPARNASVLRLIVITIGLSILIREGMLHVWDEKDRALPFFTGSDTSTVPLWGAHISTQALWVLGTCAVIVTALTLFFRFTSAGRSMRACADDRMAARLCGVNERWMVTLSFILSSGIGALAGCVISPVTQTRYDMGASLAIKGFTVAVLGGLGSSMAAVAAGLLLGLLEAFTVSQFQVAYKEVVSILVLLLVLVFRPGGLFARSGAGAAGRA